MDCIFNRCVHVDKRDGLKKGDRKLPPCEALGECGGGFALRRAGEPGGYQMVARDNPTFQKLKARGLINETRFDGSVVTVVAVKQEPNPLDPANRR